MSAAGRYVVVDGAIVDTHGCDDVSQHERVDAVTLCERLNSAEAAPAVRAVNRLPDTRARIVEGLNRLAATKVFTPDTFKEARAVMTFAATMIRMDGEFDIADHAELIGKINVSSALISDLRVLSAWDLRQRVLTQADWLGHFARCIDGLGAHGVESCRGPRDIRYAFQKLKLERA